MAIWFSSSLFRFTRLVRLFSRVCCLEAEGGRIRDEGKRRKTRNKETRPDISIYNCKGVTDKTVEVMNAVN